MNLNLLVKILLPLCVILMHFNSLAKFANIENATTYYPSDTVQKNKIIVVPAKKGSNYNYGKTVYTGNLDTLIHLIANYHNATDPRITNIFNYKTFYWKRITKPYWIYGGHCLFVKARRTKDNFYVIKMSMNTAFRNPRFYKIRVDFHKDYYQKIIDEALLKSEVNTFNI